MTDHDTDTSTPDRRANRRHFFRLLAGSTALAAIYPTLPGSWKRGVERELRLGAAAGPRPSGIPCPKCGREMVFASSSELSPDAVQEGGQLPPPTQFLEEQLDGKVLESPDQAVNVWDFERTLFSRNLPYHWSYLHLGVDDFETRRANREGFERLALRPRVLGTAGAGLDTSVQLLGRQWDTPLFLCPVAALQAYHTEGECGAARAAKARGILQIQSHQSSQSYEEIAEARGEPQWFQLYASADWTVNQTLLDRVHKAGCPVLVWTVDLLGGTNRELQTRSLGSEGTNQPLCQNCHNHNPGYSRPMMLRGSGGEGAAVRGGEGGGGRGGGRSGGRGGQSFGSDFIKRLKDATPMKIVVKGIVTREDAELAVENGADAIVVSNHGGRAANSLWGTIDSLPEVVAGVRGRVPVLLDSGVRRGADIFKALALGATAVGIGRPYVWGLGSFGQQGVDKVIAMVLSEFTMVMRQTRTASIKDIGPQFVIPGREPIMMRNNKLGFGL